MTKKKIKKVLDKLKIVCYNVIRKREGKPNKPERNNNMNKTIKEMTLEELEYARFILSMKDTWNSSDYAYDDKLFDEILRRRKEGRG